MKQLSGCGHKHDLLTGISHPALVEVLELIEDDQQAWLVEDWVDGISVAAVLDAGGGLLAR